MVDDDNSTIEENGLSQQYDPNAEMQRYLRAGRFIDSDTEAVVQYARAAVAKEAGATSGSASASASASAPDRAAAIFRAVRDDILYDPYAVSFDPDAYRASVVLSCERGFCVQKAILLAAAYRAVDIPARLGFADIRNHLVPARLKAAMGTDLFVYHGYVEAWLEGRWLKATPAFNRTLTERFGYRTLTFDGRHDSLLHPTDREGNRHMEYIRDHGTFAAFPLDAMRDAFAEAYPHLVEWARSRTLRER